jgi:hypothetical protein
VSEGETKIEKDKVSTDFFGRSGSNRFNRQLVSARRQLTFSRTLHLAHRFTQLVDGPEYFSGDRFSGCRRQSAQWERNCLCILSSHPMVYPRVLTFASIVDPGNLETLTGSSGVAP